MQRYVTPLKHTHMRAAVCARASKLGTVVYKDVSKDVGPVCATCRYFRRNPDKPSEGKCTHMVSTTIDIIHGSLTFDTAYNMRKNDNLCGLHARFYTKEHPWIIVMRNSEDVQSFLRDMKKLVAFLVRFFITFVCFNMIFKIMVPHT